MNKSAILKLIGSGGSADVFRLAGGRVLKLFREGLDPGVVEREHDGARIALQRGLHVARPLGTAERNGRRGIVFEELEGRQLLDHPFFRIDMTRAALADLADYHAGIHRCSAEGLVHAQHDIIHVRILHAQTSEELKAIALERLHAIPRGDRLCHGDFHPGNAIMTDDGLAAIDWSNGSAGDPAGDVARTELLFRYTGYGPALRNFPPLRVIRRFAANFYLRRYRDVTGVTEAAIDAWRLPMAVAALGAESQVDRGALIAALARQGYEA